MEQRVRNLGIVAHINAGKTTLSERILYDTGKQRWMGEVESGTATMDWMREEQERGISIQAAVTCVGWRGHVINLIDTPGHVDFTVEVERCLQVLDGVVVLVDGVRGVEPQTETVWRQAIELGVPRIAFVNKLDRSVADFAACLESIEQRLHCRPVALVKPLHEDGRLVGLRELVSGRASGEADDSGGAAADAKSSQERLDVVAACADFDDAVMAAFVDGAPIDDAALHDVLRRTTLSGELVPVLGGSALHNQGIDLLLDAVCRYLPSPVDRLAAEDRSDHAAQPFAALVFKVQSDDDRVGFIRVYHGRLQRGDTVEAAGGESFVVDHIWLMNADQRDEIAAAGPGHIVAVSLPDSVVTGDTLRAPGGDVVLERRRFSAPVLTVSLEPRAAGDREILEQRAREIAAEDPTLRVRRNDLTRTLLVAGMGELHLEVFASRMEHALPGVARFGKPEVELRETVAAIGSGRAECQRTIDDKVFSASAEVRVEPLAATDRVEVDVDPANASEFAAEVAAGLREVVETGVIHAYPVVGVAFFVCADGRSSADAMAGTLSTEAAELAARRALEAAEPVILEPWMRFAIDCPHDTLSFVLADLRSRGAEIAEILPGPEVTAVEGRIALSRTLGYATSLRSMTRGHGHAEFRLDRFEPRES